MLCYVMLCYVPQTPLGELTALPRPPSWIWGAASRQGRGWAGVEEGKGEGKRREREVEGREREGPQVTVEPGPLRALLRDWMKSRILCLDETCVFCLLCFVDVGIYLRHRSPAVNISMSDEENDVGRL